MYREYGISRMKDLWDAAPDGQYQMNGGVRRFDPSVFLINRRTNSNCSDRLLIPSVNLRPAQDTMALKGILK